MKSSKRAADNLVFWRGFLLPISLYVVLGADRTQFEILGEVSNGYFTLSGPMFRKGSQEVGQISKIPILQILNPFRPFPLIFY